MKLLSIQVGLPRDVQWQGRTVTTGIFRDRVEGPVTLRTLNLDGNGQADLTIHGGADKAVYAYPMEHYEYRRREFPGMELLNMTATNACQFTWMPSETVSDEASKNRNHRTNAKSTEKIKMTTNDKTAGKPKMSERIEQ